MLPDNDQKDVLSEDTIPLMLITNEPTELKLRTLELLYQSMSFGQLAYLDGKDPETGEIVSLLVGIQPENDSKASIYPIAKFLDKDDNTKYLIPDGNGNYSSIDVGEPIDLGLDFERPFATTDSTDSAGA
jgi:hypothetical protein